MAKNVYQFKGNFKSFLFVFAVVITFASLYFTQLLVIELQKQSREFLNLRIKIFEENINNEELKDINFFFREVIQKIDYPIIYTDAERNAQFWRNLGIPDTPNRPMSPDTLQRVEKILAELGDMNPPIPISFQGNILGYIYYGESAIIQKLRWLPIIEILVVAMFILIGYAGFSSIKKSEERFIWVGMAKETAHQLGTPLSSQIGWMEYLKSAPDQVEKVIPELEKDLNRLKIVTNRFSQIGSLPDFKPENLIEIIEDLVQYFQNRIPQKNGKTQIQTRLDPNIAHIMLNKDLFSWVLENLIKNALDALENKGGSIILTSGMFDKSKIYIDVSDSGKGMNGKVKKNVFKPGFSTKRRGWGLGLSLAKRIVEDYHRGKLLVKESTPGKGTTFRIILNSNVN